MDSKINLRIEANIKFGLEELASENNQSLSEYLRDLLTEHVLDPTGFEEDFIDLDNPDSYIDLGTVTIDAAKNYEQSFDFTYLVVWLFCRYMHPVETNDKAVIKNIKSKVERVINESSFSQELKLEFVKVLNDINRFLVEPDYQNKQFYFPTFNHLLSFDYYRMMNEIWSKKS